jgi:hypothetical protein
MYFCLLVASSQMYENHPFLQDATRCMSEGLKKLKIEKILKTDIS